MKINFWFLRLTPLTCLKLRRSLPSKTAQISSDFPHMTTMNPWIERSKAIALKEPIKDYNEVHAIFFVCLLLTQFFERARCWNEIIFVFNLIKALGTPACRDFCNICKLIAKLILTDIQSRSCHWLSFRITWTSILSWYWELQVFVYTIFEISGGRQFTFTTHRLWFGRAFAQSKPHLL